MNKLGLKNNVGLLVMSIAVLLMTSGFEMIMTINPEYSYTEKLVSAKKGGTVEIANRCIMVIPPNALGVDTVITMEAFTTEEFIGEERIEMVFNFGPTPLQFSKNVQVTLPWDDYFEGTGDMVNLYNYDEADQDWEKQNALITNVPGKRLVRFQVDHFSRYAVASPVKNF